MLQGANLFALVVTIAVNALANILPLNGVTTAEVSDMYPSLITPAGYVFSIWGVIYVLLAIFAVYQAMPARREEPLLGKIGWLFVLGSAANIAWLFLWHYLQVVPSLAAMFALLGTLIAIYLRLDIGRSDAPRGERLYVHLPFSVYLGWITVAPIANVSAALVSLGWGGLGLGEATWAVLVIAVAVLITLAVVATRRDIAYSLVIVWALAGIAVKQAAVQPVFLSSVVGAVVVLLALIGSRLIR